VVADGELLVVRDGTVMPFNDLQQRLNRKTVTARMLEQYPAHLRLYDLLAARRRRPAPAALRGAPRRLESWHADVQPPRSDLSANSSTSRASRNSTNCGPARAPGSSRA
jgi:DNA ligase 1